MRKNLILVSAITVAAIAIVVGLYVATSGSSGQAGPDLGPFAACLKDKGIVFYGAFWCPHCQAEKALFGKAVDKLPYVECSTPDGNSQTQACTEKGIEKYPTWTFPDGSKVTGDLSLDELAARSGCTLPSVTSTSVSSSSASSSTSAQ